MQHKEFYYKLINYMLEGGKNPGGVRGPYSRGQASVAPSTPLRGEACCSGRKPKRIH